MLPATTCRPRSTPRNAEAELYDMAVLTNPNYNGDVGQPIYGGRFAPTGPFPLSIDAAKRYLVRADGNPFFLNGDTPWSLAVRTTTAQVDQYLANRVAKGINTAMFNVVEHLVADSPPANAYGEAPFSTTGDFSTWREAYFTHIDYIVNAAEAAGILLLMCPAYLGYAGGSEGWYADMSASGTTKLTAYGTFIGARYAANKNIVWVMGGDYNVPSGNLPLVTAVADGIAAGGSTHPMTYHADRDTSARLSNAGAAPWLGLNNIYTSEPTVVAKAFAEYAGSTKPFFLIEAVYEGAGAYPWTLRHEAYQALLSGACGHMMGNDPLWQLNTGWQAAMDLPGSTALTHIKALFESKSWWTLVPDTGNTLLTAGYGTAAYRAVAALSADTSFGIIYTPANVGMTVDMSKFAGPNVIARWFDPTDGSYAAVSGSPFAASGTHVFTPTGSNSESDDDWVLLLESTT